jgi:hypothetical protein
MRAQLVSELLYRDWSVAVAEPNGISQIFLLLRPPQRRAMLHGPSEPLIDRTTWACGCVADHFNANEFPCQWEKCAGHALAVLGRLAESAATAC